MGPPMIAPPTSRATATSALFGVALPCGLSDSVAEMVTAPPDPYARAEVVCSLVREVYESIAWLHGAHPPPGGELDSLQDLVLAAETHHARMRPAHGGGGAEVTR